MEIISKLIQEKEREESEEKRQKIIRKLEEAYDYYLRRAWKEELSIGNYKRLQWLKNLYNRYKPKDIERIRYISDELKNMIMTQTEERGDDFCRIWKIEIRIDTERYI
jgi:hypothetical protein